MNDHELCKYIKENYDVERDQSIVLVIDFNINGPQFKEYHFKTEREENIFVFSLAYRSVFAILKYYNSEKIFYIHGNDYLGTENLITGEIYEWRIKPKGKGRITPEKIKAELRQLFEFLKKQTS